VTLAEMIPMTAVLVPLRASDVGGALIEVADALAFAHGIGRDLVRRELSSREKLGSTAVGESVALPHCRAEIPRTIGALAISTRGIPWDAPDDMPVRLVVALVSPREGSEHLTALATVARAFIDPTLRARLLAASDARQAHDLLVARGA
jgi:PTS system nitrogen regulatory IIA component